MHFYASRFFLTATFLSAAVVAWLAPGHAQVPPPADPTEMPDMAEQDAGRLTLSNAEPLAEPALDLPVDRNDVGQMLDRRTEAAIKRYLSFLKDTQTPDGSWGANDSNCTAYTALSMIAFMLNGHFPNEKQPYGPTLKKALDHLLQDGKRSIRGYMGTNMYSHGLATLALSEAWGQTDRDDEIQEGLKAGVGVILRSQSPIGGWRYAPVPGAADVSVTAMQLVALSAARQAGILVPNQTIDRAVRYIHLCRDEVSGGFYYTAGGGTPAFARSAAATFSLMMCGRHESAEVKGGVRYLESLPADKFRNCDHFFYGHYYAALVMSMAGDEHFRAWYPQIRDAVLAQQTRKGNWTNASYDTSMAVIILSIPYSFVPAYQK